MTQYTDSKYDSREESKDVEYKRCSVDPSDPNTIPKYVDPLPMPKIAEPEFCNEKATGYRISMNETYHKFHSHFPKTKVWGYNGKYPGPTIETFKDRTTYVK